MRQQDKTKKINEALKYLDELVTADEIIEKEIVKVGNGCHITLPLKHKGKIAKIIIKGGHHPCQECKRPIYGKYLAICESCSMKREEEAILGGRALLKKMLEKNLSNPKISDEDKKEARETLEKIKKSEDKT